MLQYSDTPFGKNTVQNDLDIAKLKKVDDIIGLMQKRFVLDSDAIF